ncbi:TPA: hypothetical protein ENG04_08205, partial [Candidatus Poribacteria bacterium]|nr:hypothetical protein [Candidatus Poribacteria bacterium]HEX30047.1 hypothetical protein [Candidatus Poribacteria bacterium]
MKVKSWMVLIIFFIIGVVASAKAGEPARIKIEAEPQSTAADGVSTVRLKVKVEDAEGNPVPDGTVVTFLSDKAQLTGADLNPDVEGLQVATKNGIAQTT